MASKRKSHVPQSKSSSDSNQVLERKLRPVYDYLDYSNNKKALQEVDKVLKKHPNSNTAKALKALALIRLGRRQDAVAVYMAVHESRPSDDGTMQVLNICYKETNSLELIAEMYEHVVEETPDSEDYLSHLFMAHARLGNYKRQHQIAVKLHKLKPDNNPYHYWGVMSLVMQSLDAPNASILLTLAERMIRMKRKNMAELELNAEVTLLCLILEKQGRLTESLDVLQGPLGNNLKTDIIFKETRIAGLLLATGRVGEANALYKKLIVDRPDNWEFYTSYISTCLQMVHTGYIPPDGCTDCSYTIEAALEFLQDNYTTNLASDKPQRAPSLALLEMYSRLMDQSGDNVDHLRSQKLFECFLDYCERFGSKQCCYKDIAKYFPYLKMNLSAEVILERFCSTMKIETYPDADITHITEPKEIQKYVLYHQLIMLSGVMKDMTKEQRVDRSHTLISYYWYFLSNVEKNTLLTDVKVSDGFILLAVHVLMEVYEEAGDKKHLQLMLTWLERGLRLSPATHQISLLLVYIYTIIGAYGSVPLLISRMEVKQILFDSFGYVYSTQAMAYGQYSAAYTQYDLMLKYFNSSNREICDCLIQCYKYGTFSKVEEFIDYQKRTAHSVQYAIAINERHILDLIYKCKSYDTLSDTVACMDCTPDQDTIEWDKLTDNRDIPVVDFWDQRQFTEEHRQQTFDEQKYWLKLRNLTVRILTTSVCLGDNISGGSTFSPDLLKNLINDFNGQLMVWNQQEDAQVPMFTTLPTMLSQRVRSGLLDIFVDMATVVMEIINISSSSADYQPQPSLSERFSKITESLSRCCRAVNWPYPTGDIVSYRAIATYVSGLSGITEHLSFAVIFAGVFWRFYQPVRQQANPRKKKQGGQSRPPVSPSLTAAHTALKTYINKLKGMIDDTMSKTVIISTENITEGLDQLAIEDRDGLGKFITKNVAISYDRSAKEINELLSHKKRFLESLISS